MIDLGTKSPGPCCAPEPKTDEEHVSYPGVWLTFTGEDPELPESGVITFKFRRTGKTVRSKKDDSPGRIEYDLELRAISSVKGGKAKVKSAEEALDDLAAEIEDD